MPCIVADYGAVGGDGAADTAAFTAAFDDINSGVIKRLHVPSLPGAGPYTATKYRIIAPLPPIQDRGFHIYGDSKWETQLIRDYDAANGTGCIDVRGASVGAAIERLTIASAAGRAGGSAVYVLSDPGEGYAAGKFTLRDVNLTSYGTNSWQHTLWVNGSAKTAAPIGVRTLHLDNVEIFGGAEYAAVFSGVVGLSWVGGGCWPASGTGGKSGAVLITGTPQVRSSSVNINVQYMHGLMLNNCHHGIITAAAFGVMDNGYSVYGDPVTCQNFHAVGPKNGPSNLPPLPI